MKNSHVIIENPYEKEKSIMLMEGSECVSCHSSSIRIVKEPIHGTFKNHYYCTDCGTEWYGSAYDSCTYEPVSKRNSLFSMHRNIYVSTLVLFIVFLKVFPIYAVLMALVASCLGVMHYSHQKDLLILKIGILCTIISLLVMIL